MLSARGIIWEGERSSHPWSACIKAAMSQASEIRQVSANVWQTFLDSYGRTLDEYSIRKWTFYKVSYKLA